MWTYVLGTVSDMIPHAYHTWEEWNAYVNDLTDAPEWVDGNDSGLCCHDCQTIVVTR